MLEIGSKLDWPKNVWMGVTVEHSNYLSRINDLRRTPAHIKFLSLEPLIGQLGKFDLSGIDWVICGGESGPGARSIEQKWVTEIRDQCVITQTPFFFKQWGGVRKKKNGRILEGRTWSETPLLVIT
jgi:protein gp37